ncbi:polysaccharide biosynthesis protein [Bacillus sp. B1-b2]|uniref:polysaccharide biosynthesis protein n=1 Tax=Bacillus sp. B1-b2 TaxID=2653201 RepID=UPI00126281A0|nr:polysaccharide biosynthesis protein [Bacillus sp. B1-b2]KAB7672506.1 polysaccharide biosynthesis protein [Bacillus sp. B1-b2]
MSSFYKGTLLLIVTAFFGECIEFLVNMVMARELGEHGLGLYMTILPTIFLIVLLASFELPTSISKFIAEKDSNYHVGMLQQVLKWTIIFTIVLTIIASIVIPFIPMFKSYHPLLKWMVILLLPIISFTSIARGYFMGKQQMGKIAVSNFLRKIVQLGLLVFLFQWFSFDIETSVLIAFFTIVGSDMVVFLYLMHMFFVQYQRIRKEKNTILSGKAIWKDLLSVSIPTTGLRIFHALTHAIQPFLIKGALVASGISAANATEQFGMLAGIAFTIGFFPSFIAHSFMTMLIPTVSKAYAQRDYTKLQKLLQQVMIITLIYGTVAVGIFYFYADSLTMTFFHSTQAAAIVQLLWPYFLLHYFTIPMQAYLIGLGLLKDAVFHSVWSTIFSYSAIYYLGSLSELQMGGIAIGMNLGAAILASLHYLTICKKIGFSIWLVPVNKIS